MKLYQRRERQAATDLKQPEVKSNITRPTESDEVVEESCFQVQCRQAVNGSLLGLYRRLGRLIVDGSGPLSGKTQAAFVWHGCIF
jgi:hypothetical protein